ncbi:MAG: NADH-quinone oxidoreductase subunit NuoE [Candidatus Coatesbacteria bacterium]|nr:NADH-quinone oxidoreductase subunit NuoE [Candidatus Coatesbacteria bacterium]
MTDNNGDYGTGRGRLISALAKIQKKHGYLPEDALSELSRKMGISKSEVYGVATFYSQFKFDPPAKHTLHICLGTACHVRGGMKILESVRKRFKVNPGETTEDRKFALERVACLGCCALAPVVVLDGEIHGKMTPESVDKLIDDLDAPERGV